MGAFVTAVQLDAVGVGVPAGEGIAGNSRWIFHSHPTLYAFASLPDPLSTCPGKVLPEERPVLTVEVPPKTAPCTALGRCIQPAPHHSAAPGRLPTAAKDPGRRQRS